MRSRALEFVRKVRSVSWCWTAPTPSRQESYVCSVALSRRDWLLRGGSAMILRLCFAGSRDIGLGIIDDCGGSGGEQGCNDQRGDERRTSPGDGWLRREGLRHDDSVGRDGHPHEEGWTAESLQAAEPGDHGGRNPRVRHSGRRMGVVLHVKGRRCCHSSGRPRGRCRRRQGACVQAPADQLQWSEDRKYWWDGSTWVDATRTAPPTAKLSENGETWWDGESWRPVPTATVGDADSADPSTPTA